MKKILLIYFFFLSQQFLKAQDWPVGTTWVYDQIDFGPSNSYNYVIFKIVRDTIIQNQDAKILNTYSWNSTWDSTHIPDYPKNYIIKTDLGKVSLWVPDSSKYLLLYDFNLQPGDTADLYIGPYGNNRTESSHVRYQIDSIQLIQTSGPLKKEFFYHRTGGRACFNYNNSVIEDIGCTSYFFQTFCVVDPPPGGYLDCFTNGSFTYPKGVQCKLPLGNKEIPPFNPDIYPNPCHDVLSIKNLDITDYTMEIFNLMGQPFPFTIKNNQFNISHIPSGVYILKLTNKAIRYSIKIYKL